MITVYFDYGSHTEEVATFKDDSLYVKCSPILEEEARSIDCKVIETDDNL